VGLSGDQKALLRLLAQREQGYDDVAALMGLSVDEVRVRVKDALDAVEREGGEATAAPVEVPKAAAEKPEAAPMAKQPNPPESEPAKTSLSKPAAKTAKKPSGSKLPKERRVWAIAAGLGAVVVVILLLATGVIGGDDSGSDSEAGDTVAQRQPGDEQITGAVLKPLDGGDAKGRAVLGKEGKTAAMIVEATGLEPSGKGSSYAIWLYKSPQKRIPLIFAKVDDSGRLLTQFKVPTEVLAYLAAGTFDQVYVSLGANKEFASSLAAAKQAGKSPTYAGTDVLGGEVTGPLTEIDLKQGN
jgi:hypothetical protein